MVGIPHETYKKIIHNRQLHTDYQKTKITLNTTLCMPGSGIKVTIPGGRRMCALPDLEKLEIQWFDQRVFL